MKMTKTKVTPKMAAEWLTRNINNRPRSKATVRKYAGVISRGEWRLNGESIKFNTNGDLIDGQHRLSACVSADLPIEVYVARDVPHEAFDTIDQGKKRTIADVLARQKVKHYTMIASAMRLLYIHQVRNGGGSPSVDQALELLSNHPGIHDAASFSSHHKDQRLLTPSVLAFLVYGSDCDDIESSRTFWDCIASSTGISKGTTAHSLHKMLTENAISQAKIPQYNLVLLCIKAWNAHISGKTLRKIEISPGEPQPKFKTLLSMKGE